MISTAENTNLTKTESNPKVKKKIIKLHIDDSLNDDNEQPTSSAKDDYEFPDDDYIKLPPLEPTTSSKSKKTSKSAEIPNSTPANSRNVSKIKEAREIKENNAQPAQQTATKESNSYAAKNNELAAEVEKCRQYLQIKIPKYSNWIRRIFNLEST